MTTHLADYLKASAREHAARTAVVDPAGWSLTFAELDRQADALAAVLLSQGVRPGDRVGLALPKGIPSVVSLFGIMKAGAAYVPIDASSPAERGRTILTDCQVIALIATRQTQAMAPTDAGSLAAIVLVGESPDSAPTAPHAVRYDDVVSTGESPAPQPRRPDDLAYILYTSGSTGIPKGVMLTHRNATSFVDWCSSVLQPTPEDRFSSHAPFHFDLSILDIYVSLKHGATLYLISEEAGKNPKDLAQFIQTHRLTMWYSTPSILTLLVQFAKLETFDHSSLRVVNFAGEVFPVKHLRDLKRFWPAPVYYNLYGPTETNVCTFARIPDEVPESRDQPYPIGFACTHCTPLVLDTDGKDVPAGGEGLLWISGDSVFQGYWNRPVENAAAFLERDGRRWYNTGDVVRFEPHDGYIYVGRRDRMVKRRGYRIELGEIERAMYRHPAVREAAVVAIPDAEGVRIVAFLACGESARPSIIEMKSFSAAQLPGYMSPDRFVFRDVLPKTSTDKTDYQTLVKDAARVS
jgi:amino acid adenylation domain-containing protein